MYSDGVDISGGPNKGPLFKCTVTLNQKEIFEGTGSSKKAAKSAAAEKALNEMFKVNSLWFICLFCNRYICFVLP